MGDLGEPIKTVDVPEPTEIKVPQPEEVPA